MLLAAKEEGIPFVASAEPCYIYKHEQLIHEIYINTKGLNGARHRLFSYKDNQGGKTKYPLLNFLTTEEMKREFSFLDDEGLIEDLVVNNSKLIFEMIEDIKIFKDGYSVPKIKDSRKLLEKKLKDNLLKKYGDKPHIEVINRLKREIEPILKNGFDGIY